VNKSAKQQYSAFDVGCHQWQTPNNTTVTSIQSTP